MSALMSTNDIWEVKVYTAFGSQLGEMVYHYSVGATTGSASGLELAINVEETVHAALKACMSSSATFLGVGARKIWPEPISLEYRSAAHKGAGTSAASVLPPQCCGLFRELTDFPYPSGRGRSFVPFPSTLALAPTGGTCTAAYTSAVATYASELWGFELVDDGFGNTAEVALVLYSRVAGKHNAAHSARTVEQVEAETEFATQRRRGLFGRQNVVTFP